MRHVRGFTLLELIVVIAIFAVFSLLAYGGLDSVLKTRQQVEQSQIRLAELQKAYQRIRDDLQQVAPRPIRDGYGDVQPALRSFESPLGLEFTRGGWRNPIQQARSTLERVSYRLDDGKLRRISFRVLDQSQDSKPVDVVLLDGVDEWALRYLDTSEEWKTRWPDLATTPGEAASPPPPRAVELTLKIRDLGEVRWLFPLGLDKVTIPAAAGGTASGTTPGGGTPGGTTTGGTTGGTPGGTDGGGGATGGTGGGGTGGNALNTGEPQ